MNFVDTVWGIELTAEHSSDKLYSFLSQKKDGVWKDYPKEYDEHRRLPKDKRELYFAPCLFMAPRRKKETSIGSAWLYADLDEVNPEEGVREELTPTVYWETSKGRWQAMWLLDRPINPLGHAILNQKLTYALNADLGGWSVTKVLRVPGSISVKHGGDPWHIEVPDLDLGNCLVYSWAEMKNQLKDVNTEVVMRSGRVDIGTMRKAKEIFRKLPSKARGVVRAKTANDRSKHIYRMAMTLRDAGISPEDAATVMMLSPVGKDKYGPRQADQNSVVVAKAYMRPPKSSPSKVRVSSSNGNSRHPDEENEIAIKTLQSETLTSFMGRSFKPPRWLIDRIWSEDAHGLIVGEHKTYKSMLAVDLAVAVASGTKFLNYFDVPTRGPVLYVQQENTLGFVKDRLEKVLTSRGLNDTATVVGERTIQLESPGELPLHLMNNQEVALNNPVHMQMLYEKARVNGIKLMILDPLYLMMPGVDENSSFAMTPILKGLLKFKQNLDCGVLVLHHYKKQDRDSPMFGDDGRIAGSSTLTRWYESMLMIERGQDLGEVRLIPKHRMFAPGAGVTVTFDMGKIGDPYYSVLVEEAGADAADIYDQIRQILRENRDLTVAELAKIMEMKSIMLKRRLTKMEDVRVGRAAGKQSPKVELLTK